VVRPGAPKYREFVRGKEGLRSEGVRGLIQPGDFEVCFASLFGEGGEGRGGEERRGEG